MKVTAPRTVFALVCLAAAAVSYWYWSRPAPIVNLHPTGKQILALGDSLTEGVGASRGHDYVSVLAKKIGRPILNRGVAGDTTADALARLNRDVLTQEPQIVIVFLGGNDILRKIPAEHAAWGQMRPRTQCQDDLADDLDVSRLSRRSRSDQHKSDDRQSPPHRPSDPPEFMLQASPDWRSGVLSNVSHNRRSSVKAVFAMNANYSYLHK